MPKAILTDARIGALVARNTPYERRDGKFKGFGVRVTPAGRKRFFVHCRHKGERVWKPRAFFVNRSCLRKRILPRFAGRNIANIDRREVRNRFAAPAGTPAATNRSLPILSAIMKEVERMGLRPEGSDPCRNIRRYRRKVRERFLSREEIARLPGHSSTRVTLRPPR